MNEKEMTYDTTDQVFGQYSIVRLCVCKSAYRIDMTNVHWKKSVILIHHL